MRVPNSVKIDKEGFYLGRTLISYVAAVEGCNKVTPLFIRKLKKATFLGNTQVTTRGATWMLPSVT